MKKIFNHPEIFYNDNLANLAIASGVIFNYETHREALTAEVGRLLDEYLKLHDLKQAADYAKAHLNISGWIVETKDDLVNEIVNSDMFYGMMTNLKFAWADLTEEEAKYYMQVLSDTDLRDDALPQSKINEILENRSYEQFIQEFSSYLEM